MRVLSISPELPSAGTPGTMAPTLRQLQSLQALGVDVEIFDMKGIPKLKYAQAIPRVRAAARHVDLIHAHFGYCGWLAQTQRRRPIVMSFMGSDLLGEPDADGNLEWFSRVMIRANRHLARLVQAVIVKSKEMAKVIEPVEAHVIPNGVNVDLFQPRNKQQVRAKLGWPDDRYYVLFPGNPSNPRKGYPLAVESVRRAQASVARDIKLVELRDVSPDQVADYMNACDAMLMTSLLEGSPNVVKEAMASDLRVVAVPVGDVVALLSGVPGYAVCDRDPGAIGDRLSRFLMDPPVVAGCEAIRRRELDLPSVARRVLRIYRQVLGRIDDTSATVAPSDRFATAAANRNEG